MDPGRRISTPFASIGPTGGKSVLTGFYLSAPTTPSFRSSTTGPGDGRASRGRVWRVSGRFCRQDDVRRVHVPPKISGRTAAFTKRTSTRSGGRLQAPLAERWSLTAEAAVPTGKLRSGFGGYSISTMKPGRNFPGRPSSCSAEFSSAATTRPPRTASRAGIPPFSRWAEMERIADLPVEHAKPRTGVIGPFIVLLRDGAFSFAENARLLLTWHELRAPENSSPSGFPSGSGVEAGRLFIARLN